MSLDIKRRNEEIYAEMRLQALLLASFNDKFSTPTVHEKRAEKDSCELCRDLLRLPSCHISLYYEKG